MSFSPRDSPGGATVACIAGATAGATGRLMLALAAVAAATACQRAPAARTVVLQGPTMGSTWSVKIVPPAAGFGVAERDALQRAIREDLALVNRRLSTWDPDSELSRFNASRTTEVVRVGKETFEVLDSAARVSAETGGAFDITMAPLVDAWGFGASETPPPAPGEAALRELSALVGAGLVELDPASSSVRKRNPGVRLDVSGIAPGYAADRLAALLEARGLTDFLVDVGGELVARGHNDAGRPWQVAIERPQVAGRAVARIVSLSNAAIATSGDYRKYHEVNGERVAHILDPRTGRPIRHRLASASVIDRAAARADALATAMMVLGPDEGLALAERLQVPVLFLVRREDGSFEERPSSRFEPFMKAG